MPTPTTSTDFLDVVSKSGLVEKARLEAFLEPLLASGSLPPSPKKLATLMLREGLLTLFQTGQLLQGKSKGFRIANYKVLEKLGSGGMGNVYLCQHTMMHRCVAIKVLPTERSREKVSRERFKREARAIAALDHPNIVRAYDLGKEGHLHYLVMEYVEGVNLKALVERTGPLTIEQSAHYIRQAALGLQHAHNAGLIHRDIKPENLLVTPTGLVKILDMGLVLVMGRSEGDLTERFDKGNVLGTADYLAPEQAINSHNVDVRADIYSLGATLYLILTGKTLFGEATIAQKLLYHQIRPVTPANEVRSEVPEPLNAVVMKMLAKKPDERYRTPEEVADALLPWALGNPPPPPIEPFTKLSPAAKAVLGAESRSASGLQLPEPLTNSPGSETEKPTLVSGKTEPEMTRTQPVDRRKPRPWYAGVFLWIAVSGALLFTSLVLVIVLLVMMLNKE